MLHEGRIPVAIETDQYRCGTDARQCRFIDRKFLVSEGLSTHCLLFDQPLQDNGLVVLRLDECKDMFLPHKPKS
jgi:hypothetical protein